MSVQSWREWFVPPEGEEDRSEQQLNDQVRTDSGSGHRGEGSLKPPPSGQARCVTCREDMDYDDGMYIMIGGDWRLHIACFNEQIERHYEDGQVIDLTTGAIINIDDGCK